MFVRVFSHISSVYAKCGRHCQMQMRRLRKLVKESGESQTKEWERGGGEESSRIASQLSVGTALPCDACECSSFVIGNANARHMCHHVKKDTKIDIHTHSVTSQPFQWRCDCAWVQVGFPSSKEENACICSHFLSCVCVWLYKYVYLCCYYCRLARRKSPSCLLSHGWILKLIVIS